MKVLTIIGGIIIASLICLQTIWLSDAYNASANQFDHTVSVALYAVADTMTENAVVEKRSSNFFYVRMNCPASIQLIDTLIQKEFAIRNLGLDYEIGVYDVEDDSLVHGKYVSASSSVQNIPEKELDLCNKDFAVLFPKKENYLVGQMDLWIFSSFLLILISSLFVHFIARLKSTGNSLNSHQIKLGNSRLDFHNQYLVVNGLTYRLTYKEGKILKLFFDHPNEVIEREVFLKEVWEKDGFFVERSMDVFISKLRKYLHSDKALRIENLRSIGYRLLITK